MTATVLTSYSSFCSGLCELAGQQSAEQTLLAVAAALRLDPRLATVRFVVRSSRTGVALYAFGEHSPVDAERLRHLAMQIRRVDHGARYVDYSEAERLAEVLADKLIGRYGAKSLMECELQGIPRGGLIVAGMLSYALGMPGRSVGSVFDSREDSARPLIIVDDCVLSGMRAKSVLRQSGSRPVILGVLFAPKVLETGVEVDGSTYDCVCAVGLDDLAPALHGMDYAAWRDRWARRQADAVLWVGETEYLCFAWSEPQTAVYNAVTGQIEPGFSLAPAGRCLRNRARGVPVSGMEAVLQTDGPGPLNAAPGVAWVDVDERRVAVAAFEPSRENTDSECYLLEDSAARMWSGLVRHGTVEQTALELADEYDAGSRTVGDDLRRFAIELLGLGLLVRE